MNKYLKYIPYLLIAVLLTLLIIRTNSLKGKISILEKERSELTIQVKELEKDNSNLLSEVAVLEDKTVELETTADSLRRIKNKAKIRLIETIKESKPDTILIESISALNQANDTLIEALENIISIKTETIVKQAEVIENDRIIIEDYKRLINEQETLYIKERRRKTF